jgi:hypothetical protein
VERQHHLHEENWRNPPRFKRLLVGKFAKIAAQGWAPSLVGIVVGDSAIRNFLELSNFCGRLLVPTPSKINGTSIARR